MDHNKNFENLFFIDLMRRYYLYTLPTGDKKILSKKDIQFFVALFQCVQSLFVSSYIKRHMPNIRPPYLSYIGKCHLGFYRKVIRRDDDKVKKIIFFLYRKPDMELNFINLYTYELCMYEEA